MIVDVKIDEILLQYLCKCGATATQWLNEIVESGTALCPACDRDMQLDDHAQVRT